MGEIRTVIFASQAMRDLEAIVRYVNHNAGSEIATRFGTKLVEKALSLADNSERGRIVPEVGLSYREIIFKSYRIVYRISRENVEVIRFWHAARGIPDIDSDELRNS